MQTLSPILGRTTEVEPTEWSVDPWQIVRCRETGLLFLANAPDYETLEEEFPWEVSSAAESKRRREAEPIRQRLSDGLKVIQKNLRGRRPKLFRLLREALPQPALDTPQTVLDIGCGSGRLLSRFAGLFAEEGHAIVPAGIEISAALATTAATNFQPLGGFVRQSPAISGLQQCAAESVDAIVMCSYLEHEVRPLDVLTAARRVLRPGGAIVVKVPNFDCWNRHLRGRRWCGFRFPDHVNYFTPRTLRRLSDEAGLHWQRQHRRDRSVLSDNMYAVLGKPTADAATKAA